VTAKAGGQRHAVVTGASSGIGEAIVQRLLEDGWRVTGLCRTPATHQVERLTIVPVDVTDFAALGPVVDAIGACDAFVHAAGFMRTAPLGELAAEDGAAMWRIHVDAAAYLANALLPNLAAGGRIVALSWAAEFAPRGITFDVVAPGATDTPLLSHPARAGTPPKLPPIGRFVKPSEVAALTAFLLGAEAGAITGQQIVMCGGASL
jgi:NAD(P)-dependent dehydrogenase (short-subunit alcohol dehydrogenase family)